MERLRKWPLVAMPPFGGLPGGHHQSSCTFPPRCILAIGTASSSQKRWRNHFVVFILHLQNTKAPVCQREEKNPTLMSEEREKSDALIHSLSQPCRLSHPAVPTGVLTVCKRWEVGREPEGNIQQTQISDVFSTLLQFYCTPRGFTKAFSKANK